MASFRSMSEVRWRGQGGHVMTERGQPQRTRELWAGEKGPAYHVLKNRSSRTVVTRDTEGSGERE